jgi:hypothetical protein
MVIKVDLSSSPAAISLADADDFDAFGVFVSGGDRPERLAAAIERLGRPAEDPDHVYIAISAVEALANGRAREENWAASLRAMVDAAQRHGWVAPDGPIRAHIEWDR